MGSGASAMGSASNDQLVEGFVEMYASDPAKWDYVINEGKRRYADHQKNKQQQVNSGGTVTAMNGNNEMKQAGSQPSKQFEEIALPEVAAQDKLDIFSEQLTVALNLARNNPPAFIADYLDKHLARFIDDMVYEEDITVYANGNAAKSKNSDGTIATKTVRRRLKTKEGRMAVIEAIQYMKGIPAGTIPLLQSSSYLAQAALNHALDIGKTGSTEHTVSYFASKE